MFWTCGWGGLGGEVRKGRFNKKTLLTRKTACEARKVILTPCFALLYHPFSSILVGVGEGNEEKQQKQEKSEPELKKKAIKRLHHTHHTTPHYLQASSLHE